jgi:hypothetical protein
VGRSQRLHQKGKQICHAELVEAQICLPGFVALPHAFGKLQIPVMAPGLKLTILRETTPDGFLVTPNGQNQV